MDTKEINNEATENVTENRKKRPGTAATIVLCVLFTVGAALIAGSIWYRFTFNTGFKEMLYTVFFSPLKGTNSDFVWNALKLCAPPVIIVSAIYIVVFLRSRSFLAKHPETEALKDYYAEKKEKKDKKKAAGGLTEEERKIKRNRFVRWLCVILAVSIFIGSVVGAFITLGIYPYLRSISDTTLIYDEEYVKPDISKITADGETKNLIYIYLESMETTYASTDVGGYQEMNCMPGMTRLASENLTFSDKSGGLLGGFRNPEGTRWTIAAILATTSGIPFSFPVARNSMSRRETFAPGLTNLGDILEEKGYEQEFLCGSDAEFGGRKNFFVQHGNYKIFDLFSAREKGYIAPDYKVWWGYEDLYLYEIAKDEITELASHDGPFNFTMLTVDTHHVDGYVCRLCRREYDNTTANVVSCADRQLVEFVDWIKEQDFFEDTVVIISGDHPRMDTNLVEDVEYDDRTIYNCFINVDTATENGTENRSYTPMDMFPTILEAIGFDVEGDRLGLGTSLFSPTPTLAERFAKEIAEERAKEGDPVTDEEAELLGYQKLNEEVAKYSEFYDNFSKESYKK